MAHRLNAGIIFIMKHKKLIIWGICLAVLAGLIGAFLLLGGVQKVKDILNPPTNQPQSVTLEGKVLCLPHKGDSDVNTLECAIGLQATDGKYYGLSGSTDSLTSSEGTDQKVKITGNLESQNSDKYQMDGIIAVNSFELVK